MLPWGDFSLNPPSKRRTTRFEGHLLTCLPPHLDPAPLLLEEGLPTYLLYTHLWALGPVPGQSCPVPEIPTCPSLCPPVTSQLLTTVRWPKWSWAPGTSSSSSGSATYLLWDLN